jgi:C-terminal processing protease CtpA/Prc
MGLSINRVIRIFIVVAVVVAVGWGSGAAIARAQQAYTVSDGGLFESAEDGAYLGVRLVEETEHSAGGARVTHVVEDSPADEAGLKEDDIVVEFDGEVIRGPVALTRRIHAHEPGDRVALKVVRDGGKTALEVELGRREGLGAWVPEVSWDSERWDEWQGQLKTQLEKLDRSSYSFSVPEVRGKLSAPMTFWWGRPKLGVELVETTVELREHLGGGEKEGVLISKVLSGTPASRAGIVVGDLILSVDRRSVATVGELREALADKEGQTFPIKVARQNRSVTLEVTIPAPDTDRPTGPRAGRVAPPAPEAPRAPMAGPVPPIPPLPAVPPLPPVPPVPVAERTGSV